MAHRAVHERLSGGSTVFCENILLDRAAVDADSYLGVVVGAGVGNRLDPVFGADVAGIYAYFIYARSYAFKRESVIEMYIRDYRNLYL